MGCLENFVIDHGTAVNLEIARRFALPYKPLVQVDGLEPVGELFGVSIVRGTADVIIPPNDTHVHIPAGKVYLFSDTDVASD